jgi:hypothetical protein
MHEGAIFQFIVLRTAAQGKSLERMTELESLAHGKELLDVAGQGAIYVQSQMPRCPLEAKT